MVVHPVRGASLLGKHLPAWRQLLPLPCHKHPQAHQGLQILAIKHLFLQGALSIEHTQQMLMALGICQRVICLKELLCYRHPQSDQGSPSHHHLAAVPALHSTL